MTMAVRKLSLRRLEGTSTPSTNMDGRAYTAKYYQVNAPRAAMGSTTFPSLPIPQQNCVPTMATTYQIDLYENMLNRPNLTINNLLSVFSNSLSQQTLIGKQEFLIDFIQEMTMRNINFDLGVICCDIYSEDALAQACQRKDFNFQKLSILVPGTNTYGLVVKMRKKSVTIKPVTRTEVDAVMVYDSAIPYPESVFKQIKSVSSRYPYQRLYLTAMDTPDIRVFCSSDITDWNTKLGDLAPAIKTRLLMQKNRRPSLPHVKTWNKYMAEDVAAWAVHQSKDPYVFEFPERHQNLKRIYEMFPLHHPVTPQISNSPEAEVTQPMIMAPDDDDDDDMEVEDDHSKNEEEVVVVSAPIPEKKRPLEEEQVKEDNNIPNKKQKPDVVEEEMDYDDLLKQALAEFENEINQL